ncbi:hypothetical protein DYI37_11580 [Fulvimarina endophytica]|uniref:Uncharacterized protein n=1 Tax=Fulvimarina endophytica TaxID=2293836 RepID=A0A371X331_9HYPH|nr:hypothetical protein [Fulvimarina endophytica]RFC63637.1 hypothetical protein DYI37_11580 [Fulvimarina endophytica]
MKRFIRLIVGFLTRHPSLHRMMKRTYRTLPGLQSAGRRLAFASLPPSQSGTASGNIGVRRPGYQFQPAPVGPNGVVTVEALYHLSRSL